MGDSSRVWALVSTILARGEERLHHQRERGEREITYWKHQNSLTLMFCVSQLHDSASKKISQYGDLENEIIYIFVPWKHLRQALRSRGTSGDPSSAERFLDSWECNIHVPVDKRFEKGNKLKRNENHYVSNIMLNNKILFKTENMSL